MLGLRVSAFNGGLESDLPAGWDEAERASLKAMIEARQPFLDFALTRSQAGGAVRRFRVSGEPMFNQACRFIGYRGIGVEITRQ